MKKTYAILLSAMLATAALTGCATTSGNASIVDQNKVASIKEGKSTTADVESILGAATDKDPAPDGGQTWSYMYSKTSGKEWIPVVGLMGGNVTSNTLKIVFNKKGVVTQVLKPPTQVQ
jgi:outer membrane protein assembly factor BamE (lipoprotein component of BamABCDE complex)